MPELTAEQLVKEFQIVRGDRTNWESHWQEVAELCLDRYNNTIISDLNIVTKGDKRRQKMFDATASLALERFASVMDSMLTPRQNTWHKLITNNRILQRSKLVQEYLDEVNRLLFKFRYNPKANFASQNHEDYISLGAFGSGVIFIDDLDSELGGLRYKSVPLSTCFFKENHQGIIDTIYRRIYFKADQAVQEFGEANVPEKIREVAADPTSAQANKDWEFLHIVKPNKNRDPERLDFRGMEYLSYYVSVEGPEMVEMGGFRTFPYAISRYVVGPGEIYGRSPAMTALPSMKTLNEEKKTFLKQGHRIVDPVLLAHDDGVLGTFSMRPGKINTGAMTNDGKRLVDVLPTGNLAIGSEMMDQERAVINDVFLVTLFQILVETPTMTATEVLERTREKGMLLAPTMGRQQSEKLGPMIEREIDVLSRQGLLPPMPQLMIDAQGEFEIEYDSPMSRAQRAEEATGLFNYLEYANAVFAATQDPTPYDHLDLDVVSPEMMQITAVPARWRKDIEKLQAERQARAEAAEEQQAIDAAPAMAGMAKAISGANSE
jgi:hypothetical protein